MARQIKIFDTTLRDGEQSPNCSMNISEKLLLAEQLDKLGVDVIEAGFAIASPGDFEAVKRISEVVKNATVASLSRCAKQDIDVAYEAVKGAVKPRLHVFIATSDIHMEYKLGMTKDEVLAKITEMVGYAKSLCEDIEFSCEDASRSDMDFMVKAVQTAIDAGATTINIPDTVGYTTPFEYGEMIRILRERVPDFDHVDLAVHCHNDLGLATANSLSAVLNGATQVECTINGIGERAGNTALEEVVMAINTRKDVYDLTCNVKTELIYMTSKMLTGITGIKVQPNKAIVGENAFAHESGIHQHGMMKNAQTYEIMTPASIGLVENKMVLGKHSGKHALKSKLDSMGYTVSDQELQDIFAKFKVLADNKKTVADSDIEALMCKSAFEVPESFSLERFVVNVGNTITTTSAIMLKTPSGELIESLTSSGNGPIDAAYKAINELVKEEEFELVDFLIDSVTSGTDAQGSVTVKIKSGDKVYNGHAVELDIIQSAITAYISAINNMIYDRKLISASGGANE